MYIRAFNGKIVYFNRDKYTSEKNMYKDLWRIMFNINIENEEKMEKKLLSYIKNK